MAIIVTNWGQANNSSTGVSTLAVGSGATPAGALILLFAEEGNTNGTTNIGGSASDGTNTYTSGTGQYLGGGSGPKAFGRYHYSANAASVSSATYHLAGTDRFVNVSAFYATGILTSSPLDAAVTVTKTGTSDSSNPLFSFVSGTPGTAGELFVALMAASPGTGSDWFTQDTTDGWATHPSIIRNGQANALYGGTQVNAGTGTKAWSPGNSSTVTYAAWIIGFKPAPPPSTSTFIFTPNVMP
jgi:hypothetical protein